MANSKKAIRERLEQIKESSAAMNAAKTTTLKAFVAGSDLAEEAATLGLELADLFDAKEKK